MSECMISTININSNIKEPTCGYQACNTNQALIIGGYVEVRKSLYTRVSVWIHTILNHVHTRLILHGYERSYTIYRPESYQKV